MIKLVRQTLSILFVMFWCVPGAQAAVDMNSDAYRAGNVAGKVFVAVLAILIVKKLLFSK